MPGAPRKPTKIKLLEGTYREDRHGKLEDEPNPETEIPDIPKTLNGEAKKEWLRITPLLEELGMISKINMSSLANYCKLWGRWLKAEKMIDKEGEVIMVVFDQRRGKMGSPKDDKPGDEIPMKIYCSAKKNPWVDISLKCVQECRKLATEFGLTPASISKVTATPKEKKTDNKEKDKNRFFK